MGDLTKSEYALLGQLSKANLSGYEIKRLLQKVSEACWSSSNAQIYPNLKKLEAHGLVTSQLDESSGGRNKVIYSISEKGLETLLHWLKQPAALSPERNELLLKLSYSQHLSNDELQAHLAEYKQQLLEKLVVIAAIQQHLREDHKGRADQTPLLMTYDHVEMVLRARLAWCEKYILHAGEK